MVQNRAVSSAVDRMPSVCVFGAGAVGLYLAAALEKAGLGENSLSLVCRGATYEHIHNTGESMLSTYCLSVHVIDLPLTRC